MKLIRHLLSHLFLIFFLLLIVVVFYYRSLLLPVNVLTKVNNIIASVYSPALKFSSGKDYYWAQGKQLTAPETMASTEPATETATTPESTASTEPATETATTPESTASTEPATEATTTPESTASTEPATETATTPEVTASTEPATEATTTPEVTASTEPATEATTTPEVTASTEPATETTTTPEATASTEPLVETPATPESTSHSDMSSEITTSNTGNKKMVLPKNDTMSKHHLLMKARSSFFSKNITLSEQYYIQLSQLDLDNPDVYGELGNVYYSQGKWNKASQAYYEAAVRLLAKGNNARAFYLQRIIQGLNPDLAVKLSQLIQKK
ncbi:MAG: hypothetical protein GXP13_02765 [Gammaproteobacteria bacterium]|nr:hypothetical protein [Gammaproteobacteria bacterium]